MVIQFYKFGFFILLFSRSKNHLEADEKIIYFYFH